MDFQPLPNHKLLFQKELNLIADINIRSFTEAVLEGVPEYFFHIPASSTGKYHPSYALGEGGLVRHVRATVWIAWSLFNMEPDRWNQEDKDTILSALILHDCMKNGDGSDKYTLTEHPLLMARSLRSLVEGNSAFGIVNISDDLMDSLLQISECIETHMGRWTSDYKTGQKVLEKPDTPMQQFVHLCDYLASRKFLEVNFSAVGE